VDAAGGEEDLGPFSIDEILEVTVVT